MTENDGKMREHYGNLKTIPNTLNYVTACTLLWQIVTHLRGYQKIGHFGFQNRVTFASGGADIAEKAPSQVCPLLNRI